MSARSLAYLLALVFASSIAYDLLRMPIQVSDSLGEIVSAQQSPSQMAVFRNTINSKAYFRPLRLVQIKALFDVSGGRYHLAYRGFHAALLVLAMLLFVRALRVTTASDLIAAAFGLTVFTGLHTFTGTVAAAYPINHFLEMVLFALLALNLAQGRKGWLPDIATAVIFVVAALTLESGLLVWVVIGAAWLSGMRGVSRRGLIVLTLLLAAYFYLRFVYFPTGAPSLAERSSGFLLTTLEPRELENRFGDNPLPFYAYNVAASALSVLFAEPRHGVWIAVRDWLEGEVQPWVLVALLASALTTMLIAVAAWRYARDRGRADEQGRFFVVFGGVLAANSALSYAYTKDEIMSIAGAFYALAAYAAVRRLVASQSTGRLLPKLVLGLTLFLASLGWAIRSEGLHYSLRTQAFKQRNDWATVPSAVSGDPKTLELVRQLRADALGRKVVNPRFVPYWFTRWFEEF